MTEVTRGVIAATVAAIALGVTYVDHAPVIGLIEAEVGINDTEAGLLPTALFLTSVGLMLAIGSYFDRWGTKRVVGLGLAIAAASNTAFVFAPSYEVMLVAKVFGGVASCLAFLGGVRYIAGIYRGWPPHVGLGSFGAGFPLGSALALQIVPALTLLAGGWRGGIAATSVLLLAVALAWWPFAPSAPRVVVTGHLSDALRNGNVWWCFVQHAAGFGLSLATGTWISVYLLREFGASLVLSGLLGSLLLFIGVVMSPLGAWVAARRLVTSRAVMRGSQLTSIVGLGLLALGGHIGDDAIGMAVAGALLVGCGVALPYAAVFGTAAASIRRAPAAGQALTGTGGTLGAVVFPPLMGSAIERWVS